MPRHEPPAEHPLPPDAGAASGARPSTQGTRRNVTVLDVAGYVDGVRAGDRAVLARALSLVESSLPHHRRLARDVLAQLLPHTGKAARVGITGSPGAGKSTFVDALGTRLTARGKRVAVLAIDPSSSVSGGSILGDKTRMHRLANDPHAFIRPSATAGALGGVANRTRESLLVCEAAGFDVVLVETVGVGQSEIAVSDLVDFFLTLILPGGGDELQGIKRGLIEVVDLVAVNKADGVTLPIAEQTARQYASAISCLLRPRGAWVPPVLTCSALTETGLEELWQVVETRLTEMRTDGSMDQRRKQQAERAFQALLDAGLRLLFEADPLVQERRQALGASVRAGTLLPEAAAEQLLALWQAGLERGLRPSQE